MATKVAYIIGMGKGGVAGFTYREIEVLHANGFDIALFPLIYREGPYMPAKDWPVFRPTVAKLFLSQFPRFFAKPVKYISMFLMALRANSVREFVLAMSFVGDMAKWGHGTYTVTLQTANFTRVTIVRYGLTCHLQ